MKTINRLNREFFSQDFSEEEPYAEWLERYKAIACNYARMENAIAVLSDMRDNASYVYYGGFSQTEEIFRLIHPDDLSGKHLQELRFFHFTKHRPKKERSDYYLASRLRMRNATGDYVPVLHRMFYIPGPCDDTLRLALCLYGPLLLDIPGQCVIIHSASGHIVELGKQDNTRILSARERQVLSLIDKGLTSKGIAETLSISIHTVNRHRQEILGKLQVGNAIAACRVAKELELI